MGTKHLLFSIFIVAMIFSSGCATTPALSFASNEKPKPEEIQNSRIVDKSFDDVWDKLVGNLATQFYVINNIDKESRLINVSFSTDTPENYVTGGVTRRELKGKEGTTEFTYDPAAKATFVHTYKWGVYKNLPAEALVTRTPSLGGRANVYVAPHEDGTIVTVNARFIIKVSITGTYTAKNAFGGVQDAGRLTPSTASASFNTNIPTTVTWESVGEPETVTFQSLGVFESDILAMAH
ncbi:MAG: hypothetical protein COA73_06110 [Candidatus Hydrogenedentota bacterium]|nr:MAG: hypothetical protein COA73_06110 [Candidatus Hydrogenedentota bacterium]